MYKFFAQGQNVTRKSCQNNLRSENSYVKMLMKLTLGLNFINVLRTTPFFVRTSFQQLRVWLWNKLSYKKIARKTLMKLMAVCDTPTDVWTYFFYFLIHSKFIYSSSQKIIRCGSWNFFSKIWVSEQFGLKNTSESIL